MDIEILNPVEIEKHLFSFFLMILLLKNGNVGSLIKVNGIMLSMLTLSKVTCPVRFSEPLRIEGRVSENWDGVHLVEKL